MKLDLQDIALRTLILVAGGLAALLLALKGQGQALPALAVGGTLGACVMARFGPGEGSAERASSARRTFSACKPFGPCLTSNSPRSPSFTVPYPCALVAL